MGPIGKALSLSRPASYTATKTDRPVFDQALQSFKSIQAGLTDRLAHLRDNKEALTDTRSLPMRQQIASQKGLARRGVEGEGSRQFQQRADVEMSADLANQEAEMRALTDLTNQEGGMQQLDTQFTGIINEMAATGFSQELAGLKEQMNIYMAKQGHALDAGALAIEARGAAMDMYGRFAQAAGMEFGRNPSQPISQQTYNTAGTGGGYASPYTAAGFGAGGLY